MFSSFLSITFLSDFRRQISSPSKDTSDHMRPKQSTFPLNPCGLGDCAISLAHVIYLSYCWCAYGLNFTPNLFLFHGFVLVNDGKIIQIRVQAQPGHHWWLSHLPPQCVTTKSCATVSLSSTICWHFSLMEGVIISCLDYCYSFPQPVRIPHCSHLISLPSYSCNDISQNGNVTFLLSCLKFFSEFEMPFFF